LRIAARYRSSRIRLIAGRLVNKGDDADRSEAPDDNVGALRNMGLLLLQHVFISGRENGAAQIDQECRGIAICD